MFVAKKKKYIPVEVSPSSQGGSELRVVPRDLYEETRLRCDTIRGGRLLYGGGEREGKRN